MQKATGEFLKRASQIMEQRTEDAKAKVDGLRKMEPDEKELWSGKAKEDRELTLLFQEMIQSLASTIEEEASFGFFPMGRKLIVIERFLQKYISSFPGQSSIYKEKAQDRIYSKLSEVFEVLGIPKEVLVRLWVDAI